MKEWLVYEVILLNKILRNHFLSENMQLNYASFNGLPLIISCTRSWNLAWHLLWRSTTESKNIVKLLAMSRISHTVCCEDDYFPKWNLFYLIVCFTQCTLFCSKKFVFYCRFVRRALSVGRMQRRESSVVTKRVADIGVAWLVDLACLPLFTLASIACLLQLWIQTSEFGRRPNNKTTSSPHFSSE